MAKWSIVRHAYYVAPTGRRTVRIKPAPSLSVWFRQEETHLNHKDLQASPLLVFIKSALNMSKEKKKMHPKTVKGQRNPHPLRIGSFNVRSVSSQARLDLLLKETEGTNLDILGICETTRNAELSCTTSDGRYCILGRRDPNTNAGGVGFIISPKIREKVEDIKIVSPRIATLTRQLTKTRRLLIVQIYAPTAGDDEQITEDFYDDLSRTLRRNVACTKIIQGDFNAACGSRKFGERFIGPHSSDLRSEAGERLLEFCHSEKLFISNSWFQKPPLKRWTHISPDGLHKREIDYILSSSMSPISDVYAVTSKFPSDHRIVRATLNLGRHNLSWTPPVRSTPKTLNADLIKNYFSNHILPQLGGTIDQDYSSLITFLAQAQNYALVNSPNHNEARIKDTTKIILNQLRLRKLQGLPHKDLAKQVRKSIEDDHAAFTRTRLTTAAVSRKNVKKCRRSMETLRDSPAALKGPNGRTSSTKQMSEIIEKFYTDLFSTSVPGIQALTPASPTGDLPLPFLSSEIRSTLESMPKGKAAGADKIHLETILSGGHKLHTTLAYLFSRYLEEEEIPSEWRHSSTKLLFKKGDKEDLANYRPIAVLPVLYKLFTRCLLNRIKGKLESAQPVEQAGFRSGYSTMDNIHSLCRLTEVSREYQSPLVLTFIDYTKAFDSVEIPSVLEAISSQGIHGKYVRLISSCYKDLSTDICLIDAPIRVPVNRGVRQGDPLSPALFSSTLEHAMNSLDWKNRGVRVDGRHLSHLRFADDIVLITETVNEATILLQELDDAGRSVGLSINLNKTVFMKNRFVPDNRPILLTGKALPEVTSFVYLGREINMDKELLPEIGRRQRAAWASFHGISPIISETKDRKLIADLFNSNVLPALTYASETWALTKKAENKLKTTQANIERRVLNISIKEQRNRGLHNSDIRNITKFKDVITFSDHSKHRWAGHVMRRDDSRWTKSLTTWRPFDKRRPRGRPPIRWSDSLNYRFNTTNNSSSSWYTAAYSRELWKSTWDPLLENRPNRTRNS